MPVPTAPLDRTTKVVTALATLLLVGLAAIIGSAGLRGLLPWWVAAGEVLMLLGVLWFSYALSPAGYRLDDATLVVERRAWREWSCEVAGVEPAPKRTIGLRVAGSGGFLGYYGRFWRRGLGHHRAFVTDRDRMVLVRSVADGPVLISPANPPALVQQIEQVAA